MFLFLILSALCLGAQGTSVSYNIFTNTNAGPTQRSSPVFSCFPPASEGGNHLCYSISGLAFETPQFPSGFSFDAWEASLNLTAHTTTWRQLNFANPPSEAYGGFHRYWRHNKTSIAFNGGLNAFNPATFQATCGGDRIVIYNFASESIEVRTPSGGSWGNVAGGACTEYGDDVYCWGGFSCTTFSDVKSWVKYNKATNTFTALNSVGLSELTARHHSTVNCLRGHRICYLGSGDHFGGGTIDEWTLYDIDDDTLTTLDPRDKPVNIQYVEMKCGQVWNASAPNIQVTADIELFLVIGGDNASGASGTANTIRIVWEFNDGAVKFKTFSNAGLPTVKNERLSVLPSLTNDGIVRIAEFGGYAQNADVPNITYGNQVIVYVMQ